MIAGKVTALHHDLQLAQQAMDEEAASLRVRRLRRQIDSSNALALIIGGPAVALAWLLFCLWLHS